MAKPRYGSLGHAQVWAYYAGGQLPAEIGRTLGRPPDAIFSMIYKAGGIRPAARHRSARALSLAEREEVSRGLAAGASCRTIARGLGRALSTISREVAASGGRVVPSWPAGGSWRSSWPTSSCDDGRPSRSPDG